MPPKAAPIGREPAFTARNTDETRPSIASGVRLWRKVVDVMVQMIGPTPNRKNDVAASTPVGRNRVATIVAAASTETTGPSWMARPNRMAPTRRDASSAPTTIPAP